MNYSQSNRLVENTTLNQPPSYSQSYQHPYSSPPPPSYPSTSLAYPIPSYTTSPPSSYPNAPPSYQTYQEKPLQQPIHNREVLQRGIRASYPEAHPRYYDSGIAPAYGPPSRNFSPESRDNSPALRDPGYRQTSTSSPRQRYRTIEDYHCDYRGGFRPILDSESRDGYTTDGSGSAYRDGSVRGFENFRYPPERESLLSGESTNPFFATQSNGTSYAKGKNLFTFSNIGNGVALKQITCRTLD